MINIIISSVTGLVCFATLVLLFDFAAAVFFNKDDSDD
jgi:hypothetical protein